MLGLLVAVTLVGLWMLNARAQAILDLLARNIPTEQLREELTKEINESETTDRRDKIRLANLVYNESREALQKRAGVPAKGSVHAYLIWFGLILLIVELYLFWAFGTLMN
ncbi:hypothetical protein N9Q14_03465 [Pseudomonadales bacterium]|nr:hypothetical protein [Pseudomonadales bacterium]